MNTVENKNFEKELKQIVENYNMGFITSLEYLNQIMDCYYHSLPDTAFHYIVASVSDKLRSYILRVIDPLLPIECRNIDYICRGRVRKNVLDFSGEND